MNRTIQQRRRRIADHPRPGDTIIVQYHPRTTIVRRLVVQTVSPSRSGPAGTRDVTVLTTLVRTPGLVSFGPLRSHQTAGHWWCSWPQLVRRALTTEEGQP